MSSVLRRFEAYALRADASSAAIARLRQALRDCGRFIPQVLRSAVGANRSSAALQLVWEHAYATPDDYRAYMAHPFHAAVLDRFLLADSPERVVADSRLGAGLFGYRCDAALLPPPSGVRRVLLLDVARDADPTHVAGLDRLVRDATRETAGPATSTLATNDFATRWFDAETELAPAPPWSHVCEQTFASRDALATWRTSDAALARAEREGWQSVPGGIVRRALELEYDVEAAA